MYKHTQPHTKHTHASPHTYLCILYKHMHSLLLFTVERHQHFWASLWRGCVKSTDYQYSYIELHHLWPSHQFTCRFSMGDTWSALCPFHRWKGRARFTQPDPQSGQFAQLQNLIGKVCILHDTAWEAFLSRMRPQSLSTEFGNAESSRFHPRPHRWGSGIESGSSDRQWGIATSSPPWLQ